MMRNALVLSLSTLVLVCGLASSASAIPIGYTCIGNCEMLGADGDVVAPPGGGTYDWVSTATGGVRPQDLNLGAEKNGFISVPACFRRFGDALEFDFNFVTSDGSGFADYVWGDCWTDCSTRWRCCSLRGRPNWEYRPRLWHA